MKKYIGVFLLLVAVLGVCFLTSAKEEKQSIGTEDEQEMTAETKLHVLLYDGETWAYSEPEKEDEDYRLYLFDNDVQGGSSEMENLHLKDADDVFPDARENNQSIGKFLSIYIAERVSIEGGNYLIVATYEVDGETRYDTRIYRRTENGIEFNRELSERLNQKYAAAEDYPVEEVIPMPSDSGEYGYDGSPLMLDVDTHRPKEEVVTLEDEQLMLIAQNKSQWLIEEDIYGSYQFTVTDLDHNGRLEVISTTCQGTGHYSDNRIWEVNETYDGLTECVQKIEEGVSQADMMEDPWTCYYDESTNRYHYIFADTIRNGAAEYYESLRAFTLENGTVTESFLAYKETLYTQNGVQITCKDSDSKEITEQEYENAAQNRFEGLQKMEKDIWWRDYRELSGMDEGQLYYSFRASYQWFDGSEE